MFYYFCINIPIYIYIYVYTSRRYEIDRFRSSHPGAFLKIVAPKMYAKSWKDIYEELKF